jgi:RNA recognition motif-containing protein
MPKGKDYGRIVRRDAAESKEFSPVSKITVCRYEFSSRMSTNQPSIESKASTHCSRLAVSFIVIGGIMGRKLYVGNLPYSVTEHTLQATFSQHGTVETVNLITDRDTGQSKGFGFVEMRTDAEARTAISELNGTELEGRAMKVNEAKPQERRSDSARSRSGGNRW